MNSFIVKCKNVRRLVSNLFKVEGLYSHGSFPREVHTQCILYSSITKQFIIHDLRESAQRTDNSDFGKIVNLGYDFDQLEVDDKDKEEDEIKTKKLTKKNQIKSQSIRKRKSIISQECAETNESNFEEETSFEVDKAEHNLQLNKNKKRRFKLSQDPKGKFGEIMTQIKSKKFRSNNKEIVLEGKRLIYDALQAGLKPLHIFFSRFDDIRSLNLPEDIEVAQIPYKTLSLWSDVVTSQGVIGVFEMPNLSDLALCKDAIPLIVICDNTRDPGNLGTIVRTVAAVGCEKLILTKGCVDIWESKVLRAAAGAHFRVPIVNNLTWPEIENEIPESIQVVLADKSSSDKAKDLEDSEGKNSYFETSSEFASTLPLFCYTSFKYEPSNTVIVLGGETNGLSEEAYLFASKRNGSRVYLPMCNGTESLNNSVVLGIFMYEFKRQLTCESFKKGISDDDSEVDK